MNRTKDLSSRRKEKKNTAAAPAFRHEQQSLHVRSLPTCRKQSLEGYQAAEKRKLINILKFVHKYKLVYSSRAFLLAINETVLMKPTSKL